MRKENDGTIVLSRRNLRTLLNKIDDPESSKTIEGGDDALGVRIVAECDSDHYNHPDRLSRTAGPVHPAHDPGRDDG